MIITCELEDDLLNVSRTFFQDTETRFKSMTQSLKGFIYKFDIHSFSIPEEEKTLYLLDYEIVPPYWGIFSIVCLGLLLLTGWIGWFMIGGVFSLVCAFIWSPYLFKLMIRKGLRKVGYTGTIKFLKSQQALARIIHL